MTLALSTKCPPHRGKNNMSNWNKQDIFLHSNVFLEERARAPETNQATKIQRPRKHFGGDQSMKAVEEMTCGKSISFVERASAFGWCSRCWECPGVYMVGWLDSTPNISLRLLSSASSDSSHLVKRKHSSRLWFVKQESGIWVTIDSEANCNIFLDLMRVFNPFTEMFSIQTFASSQSHPEVTGRVTVSLFHENMSNTFML